MTIISFVIGVIGFGITIWQVREAIKAAKAAKTAAERAETAARNVRASMVLATTIADCVVALAMMDDIKVHHRRYNWAPLPDLYSHLKRRLVSIRSGNDNLMEEHRLAIQGALTQFSLMEEQVERHIVNTTNGDGAAPVAAGASPATFAGAARNKAPDIARLNSVVTTQIDKLYVILTELQRSIRNQDHGG